MKKSILFLFEFALFCSVAVGCQKADPTSKVPMPSVSSQPEQTNFEEPSKTKDTKPIFKAGTWMASSGKSGQYYFFDADGISGRTATYEKGIGVGFTYEQTKDKILFHMGASDVSLPCKVVVIDDTHMTMEWDNQHTENLTFVSALDSVHFHFYSDEELCALALKHYKAKNAPNTTDLSAAASDNGDGTVTIQIYQNLSDHNSTAAWYRIDRCTGQGKNVNSGESIDLTNGSLDIDITSFDAASSTPGEAYYECIVDESQYRSNVLLSAEVPVKDFKVFSLEYTESSSYHVVKELFSISSLTPEKALVLRMELPEIIPNIGITYSDRNGERKQYTIACSGLDGAPLLIEENFLQP